MATETTTVDGTNMSTTQIIKHLNAGRCVLLADDPNGPVVAAPERVRIIDVEQSLPAGWMLAEKAASRGRHILSRHIAYPLARR
jgi:hypothetical protein